MINVLAACIIIGWIASRPVIAAIRITRNA